MTARMMYVSIAPPILSERTRSCQVSSDYGEMSPPSGGSEADVGGDRLARECVAHCSRDDLLGRRLLGAHAMAEDIRCEPGHVLGLDRLPALGRGASLGRSHQMARRTGA